MNAPLLPIAGACRCGQTRVETGEAHELLSAAIIDRRVFHATRPLEVGLRAIAEDVGSWGAGAMAYHHRSDETKS